MCKSLGGNLIELESKEEYVDVITFILAEQSIRGESEFQYREIVFRKNLH